MNAAARWLPPPMQLAYAKLKVRAGYGGSLNLVPKDDLEEHYRQALALLADRGGSAAIADYVEFGVYVGTYRVSDGWAGPGAFFGFDSLRGCQPQHARREPRWRPGCFDRTSS
jgi:hypothetical protein